MRIRNLLNQTIRAFTSAVVAATVLGAFIPAAWGQSRQVSLGVKYLNVADLQTGFAYEGAEFEMFRTGSGNMLDQCDGLRWPAQYLYQDCISAKGMWLGTTNFLDPVTNKTYPYKVVCAGPRLAYTQTEIMPTAFRLIGRFQAPSVLVDGEEASTIKLNDQLDAVDPNLVPDRMIYHVMNTSIGVTITRKALSFVQQNHGNYFIYEYTLKNTGLIDPKGAKKIDPPRKLTGVILHFQYRYAIGNEAYQRGWSVSGEVTYGRNAVLETIGTNPAAAGFLFRAQYSWYGPHSASALYGFDDWGSPNYLAGGAMGAARMIGTVVLHADKSATDRSDDLYQPKNTRFIGSDTGPLAPSQYDPDYMAQKYVDYMAYGHPAKTHAQEVGNGYGDSYGSDRGGYSSCQGFGPWDLAPGDSVRVIMAEAVGGLDRLKDIEVGNNWYRKWKNKESVALIMPDKSTTTDENAYKKAWVLTAKDSLFKAFNNAIKNYNSGYKIPQPPPPPESFTVNSGGDRIFLSWADNAKTASHFDGYRVYRAVGKPDTAYKMIFECNASNAVTQFEDTTPQRGFNHYYYVVSKDDGSTNDLQKGVPLESGKFYTMTAKEAFLRRPAVQSSLNDIVVVPNPYHINAKSIQYGINQPDQISFFNLPPKCVIRIFTERGDLVKTINHTNSSGDENWDSTTEYKQLVVSGLYIAQFEVTEDVVNASTNAVPLKKGEKAFRKFIIIR
jgi:hypothetical protein